MAGDDFAKALKRRRRISITVNDRRTRHAITIPVWFVYDDGLLWLLPANGSDTQWYRNLMNDRAIGVRVGELRGDFRARLVKDAAVLSTVVQKFRRKYTADKIKRWYIRLDTAVKIPLELPAPNA